MRSINYASNLVWLTGNWAPDLLHGKPVLCRLYHCARRCSSVWTLIECYMVVRLPDQLPHRNLILDLACDLWVTKTRSFKALKLGDVWWHMCVTKLVCMNTLSRQLMSSTQWFMLVQNKLPIALNIKVKSIKLPKTSNFKSKHLSKFEPINPI